MNKLLNKIARLYLRLRVKDAHRLGTMDATSGKISW